MQTGSYEEIFCQNREYTFFSWSIQSAIHPIAMAGGKGVYFWDVNGKRYLDFASQSMNVNIGHQHPKVIAAIKEQADVFCCASANAATRVKGELGHLLAEITPGDLCKTFFVLGGAEANEYAIRLARMYTGRQKIITRYRSYHGATAGAITLSGDPRRLPAEPGVPGVVRVFDPYCYRCIFGKELHTCNRECITHIEEIIRFEGPENIAAILMEGVTGTNGIFVPPDDYWPYLRQICDRYGILLISDEVMSGFGRTGKWFAVDNWGVVPDIMTMAKGLTSGYLPLGAVTVSKPIADYFEDRMLWLGLTYSGHPISCAAAIATINVLKEDKLIDNARAMGKMLAKELETLKEKHPCVGDVRGIGLFHIIELVKDRESKEPLASWNANSAELSVMNQIKSALREKGLYTLVRWNWIFIAPPLCINESELKQGLTVIDEVLEMTDLWKILMGKQRRN